jgi:hypothetical protein
MPWEAIFTVGQQLRTMNYLLATDATELSETLCAVIRPDLGTEDTVFVVNSLRGGERTSDQDVLDGKDALRRVEDLLGEEVTVDTHQLVR